jgi:hypothetical protein
MPGWRCRRCSWEALAWIVTANSVSVSAQLSLPNWVRARGMAIYQMSIMGGSALGAFIWGRLAESTSVPTSLACCSVSLLVALFLTRGRVLEGAQEEDHTPTNPWPEPVPTLPIALDAGPVMITLEYLIDPGRRGEFEAIMAESRSARLRQGRRFLGALRGRRAAGAVRRVFRLRHLGRLPAALPAVHRMDERLQSMRHAFHVGDAPPRVLALHRQAPSG